MLTSPSDVATELGVRVQALRLQRNITQADLASRAGISRPTLGALEREGKGTVETLARVLYALGRESDLSEVAAPDPPMTLDELDAPTRQRARR